MKNKNQMTTRKYSRIGPMMLAFLVFTFGSLSLYAQDVEEKTIDKSYLVNAGVTLHVENERGNVSISTWDKPQIDIMVRVRVKGDDRDFLRKRAKEVKLYFSHSSDRVEARTEIGEEGWWSWLWGQESQVEVHYTVFMPVDGNVDIMNDYGDISIDTLHGRCELNCDYGNVHLGHIQGRTELNLDYSRPGSTIGYVQSLEMNVDYSKVTVDSVGRGEVNADYCIINIGAIDRLEYNGDYGHLQVSQAKDISANADYVDLDIGQIYDRFMYKGDYGSVEVQSLMPGFEKLEAKSNYVTINVGVHPDAAFRIQGDESYTRLSTDKEIELNEDAGKGISSEFSGFYLHPKAVSLIAVKMSYGKLKIDISE